MAVLEALERRAVRYAVFGGLAMAAHGFDFDDLEIERVGVGSSTIAVVTPATLYRIKRDTVRPRDRDDAQRLADAFGLDADGEIRDAGHSTP